MCTYTPRLGVGRRVDVAQRISSNGNCTGVTHWRHRVVRTTSAGTGELNTQNTHTPAEGVRAGERKMTQKTTVFLQRLNGLFGSAAGKTAGCACVCASDIIIIDTRWTRVFVRTHTHDLLNFQQHTYMAEHIHFRVATHEWWTSQVSTTLVTRCTVMSTK
jgi:hypothetical protein